MYDHAVVKYSSSCRMGFRFLGPKWCSLPVSCTLFTWIYYPMWSPLSSLSLSPLGSTFIQFFLLPSNSKVLQGHRKTDLFVCEVIEIGALRERRNNHSVNITDKGSNLFPTSWIFSHFFLKSHSIRLSILFKFQKSKLTDACFDRNHVVLSDKGCRNQEVIELLRHPCIKLKPICYFLISSIAGVMRGPNR